MACRPSRASRPRRPWTGRGEHRGAGAACCAARACAQLEQPWPGAAADRAGVPRAPAAAGTSCPAAAPRACCCLACPPGSPPARMTWRARPTAWSTSRRWVLGRTPCCRLPSWPGVQRTPHLAATGRLGARSCARTRPGRCRAAPGPRTLTRSRARRTRRPSRRTPPPSPLPSPSTAARGRTRCRTGTTRTAAAWRPTSCCCTSSPPCWTTWRP
jgi:hypothetical protein